MFTGIIEHTGKIQALDLSEDGGRVTIHAPTISPSLAVSNSIAVNGCCLTVARWQNNTAEVAIIPYSYEHTNIRDRKTGDAVNLEGDVLGKYVERYLEHRNLAAPIESQLTVRRLLDEGF